MERFIAIGDRDVFSLFFYDIENVCGWSPWKNVFINTF